MGLLALCILFSVASCDIIEAFESGSDFSFTLNGTSFEDDKNAVVRVFGAVTTNDSTVVQISVPDASTGRGMNLTLVFIGEDGTKTITQGLSNATAIDHQFSLTVFENEFDTESTDQWDATNVVMEVSNFSAEDSNLTTFDATFSGTVINADTEETVNISSGVLNVVGIR